MCCNPEPYKMLFCTVEDMHKNSSKMSATITCGSFICAKQIQSPESNTDLFQVCVYIYVYVYKEEKKLFPVHQQKKFSIFILILVQSNCFINPFVNCLLLDNLDSFNNLSPSPPPLFGCNTAGFTSQ